MSPIYELECQECGHHVETLCPTSDSKPKVCSECNGELNQLYNSPFVIFMGKAPISLYRHFTRPQRSAKPP